MPWQNVYALPPKKYVCGFCGANVGSEKGFGQQPPQYGATYICPLCDMPSYFHPSGLRSPGVPLGNSVKHVPALVNGLYEEARNCCAANAYTAAVLLCRKLLMNVAASEGAPTGQTFMQYVEFLSANGYVPPKGKVWVDHIRQKGNEATHEIQLMKEQDALDLISFSEMLLKFVFEFPHRVPSPSPGKSGTP